MTATRETVRSLLEQDDAQHTYYLVVRNTIDSESEWRVFRADEILRDWELDFLDFEATWSWETDQIIVDDGAEKVVFQMMTERDGQEAWLRQQAEPAGQLAQEWREYLSGGEETE